MKRRLIGIVCSLVLVAILLASGVVYARQLAQSALEETPVLLYPNQTQLSDYQLMLRSYQERIAQGDNPVLTFGSSELRSNTVGEYHPAQFFLDHADFSLMIMGRIHCMSLWDAIELGAFDNELEDRHVVIFVSQQWFYNSAEDDHPSEFQAIYSDDAFQAMMDNENISDETKAAIQERMAAYGVDRDYDAMDPISALIAKTDNTTSDALIGLRGALSLQGASLLAEGSDGSAVSISADIGSESEITDEQWEEYLADAAEQAEEKAADDEGWQSATYHKTVIKNSQKAWPKGNKAKGGWSEGEMEDFELLLKVCSETGIEPLIIIQPVKGAIYDDTSYDKDMRDTYYEFIHDACDEYGMEYVDFTDHNYDTYFLRDQSHPSCLGCVYYDQAIYNFVEDLD